MNRRKYGKRERGGGRERERGESVRDIGEE